MKASLTNWLKEERLKAHKTSREEIDNLFKIVNRDLSDASIPSLSADRRFITAYNAALQLSTIALRVSGYRTNPNKAGHHRISIDVLVPIFGAEVQDIADYFNACRVKRHVCDYTSSGEISDFEASELIKEVQEFKQFVLKWIKKNHPEFL